jgi:hypothetical protein
MNTRISLEKKKFNRMFISIFSLPLLTESCRCRFLIGLIICGDGGSKNILLLSLNINESSTKPGVDGK